MQPLTIILGIVFGSVVSVAFSLAIVLLVFGLRLWPAVFAGSALTKAVLRPCTSMDEIEAELRRWVAANPDAPRVLGVGWVFSALPNSTPHRDLLDAIVSDREPETGMYAGRTGVEMTTAVYASALSGDRITWPLVNRGNPLA